jgi:hypothetical protein
MIVGKFAGLIGCTLAVLLWLTTTWRTPTPVAFSFLPWLVLPAAALGAVIWTIGWILEGFQDRTNHER